MWILKFLSGPMNGHSVRLTKESTLIGRAPQCDIRIASPSVSKEHVRIEILDDRLLISDAGSRNGTFLNGVQIRNAKVLGGERISMHDIIFEVQKVPVQWTPQIQVHAGHPGTHSVSGNTAYQYQPMPGPMDSPAAAVALAEAPPSSMAQRIPAMLEGVTKYLDEKVLPGVYKLPEMFDFKWVLATFIGLFVILVTSFSTVPLIRILKLSIEEQSHQHALTIANTLAQINRQALMQGLDSGVSVEIATSRPGVKKALIISNADGNVIAPATQAGLYPDVPYLNEGRKLPTESVKQIDDNTVVAMVPIEFYNADTGTQSVSAWAVVLYDMGSIAVDNSEVLSLFISTLFIALLVGALIFYFLYKIVEYPFRNLNLQLDGALKENHDTISIKYRFPPLQALASNISSALSRTTSGGDQGNRAIEHDRNREIANLVELVGFAAIGVRSHDHSIAAVNQAFESRTGMTSATLTQMTVNEITDQALKLSLKDLIERVDQNPDDIASNKLEFTGHEFQIVSQAVFGIDKVAYYLFVLLPTEEGE